MRQIKYLEPEVISVPRTGVLIWCDKCKQPIEEDDANDLEVWVNQDACCSFFRERDYCTLCFTPIWDKINELIDADPEDERDETGTDEQD